MYILSGDQVRKADQYAIQNQGISSDDLMERAGTALFNWLHQQLQGAPVRIHLFCGIGNNGGDGLVVARHLSEHGYSLEVYIVNYSDKRSPDFLTNLDRLKDRKIWPHVLSKNDVLPNISKEDMVVDAIFGTGLNRGPDGWVSKLITHLNTSNAFIVAVDIPSGMFTDKAADNTLGIIRANFVLSFQFPKLVFFLPETGTFCEHWATLDIGLDAEYVSTLPINYELIHQKEIKTLYRPRKKFSHKGSYGHTLIIGGSFGKIGAVQLAAKACLRAGSGLVSAFVPGCGYVPFQSALPEVMVITDKDQEQLTQIKLGFQPTVVAFGIGAGTSEKTINAFETFLKENKTPLVIDADGLNILSIKKTLLKSLPPKTVLTPHPKELERLVGPWKNDFEKLDKVKEFSTTYDLIVVIKGAHTITVYKDSGYVNDSGNAGMATAGSGDVLTGVIAGLIAQDYPPFEAAFMGVYLHGRAGDIVAQEGSMEALIASDIIDYLGIAFGELLVPENEIEGSDNKEEPTS
jgi:hydroxyethylthiazole kinase-like uncharacterized protein yjeF